MNLLLAASQPILSKGGVEVLVRTLVEDLSTEHKVFLASTDAVKDLEISTIAAQLSGFIPVPSTDVNSSWAANFPSDLRKHAIDCAHFHLGGTYAWRSGSLRCSPVPYVHAAGIRCFTTNHQAITPFDLNRTDDPILRRMASFLKMLPGKTRCIGAVEKEILVSDNDLKLSRKYFPHMAGKFTRIYHSLLADEQPLDPLPDSRVLLNLATVCFRKGQHVLVDAFIRIASDFPDWRLRLVGPLTEIKCVEKIRQAIKSHKLDDRIELAGPTSEPLQELYGAELYVQPSLLEGLGLSLQEAMFLGIPGIGSATGGIPELINDGVNGLLAPAGDADNLSRKLAQLMGDRQLRERFGSSARTSILNKGMTREAMFRSYRELYHNYIS